MSNNVNLGFINRLLATPKDQWPQKNAGMNHPGIPKYIEEEVEKQRQYRYEIIMEIPPFQFMDLVRRKALPWM